MAENFGVFDGYVVPVMDARRSQVYNAVFKAEQGKLCRISEDRAISLEDLGTELKALSGPVYLVGDGSTLTYKTLKDAVPSLIMPPEHRMHQRAAGVALIGDKMIKSGINCDAAQLAPNYLRLSQAERERLERESQ